LQKTEKITGNEDCAVDYNEEEGVLDCGSKEALPITKKDEGPTSF